jgi:hypothetical protein
VLGFALVLAGVNASVISAKAISGTDRADTLVGTNRADVICGRGGNDKISGRGGNDRIYGGPGADTISCGTGTDTADKRSVANVQVDGLFDNCMPPSDEHFVVTMTGTLLIPIAADGSFDYVQPSGNLAGSLFQGAIAADGAASGTYRIVESFVYQDTQYSCDTSVFGWTAKLGA